MSPADVFPPISLKRLFRFPNSCSAAPHSNYSRSLAYSWKSTIFTLRLWALKIKSTWISIAFWICYVWKELKGNINTHEHWRYFSFLSLLHPREMNRNQKNTKMNLLWNCYDERREIYGSEAFPPGLLATVCDKRWWAQSLFVGWGWTFFLRCCLRLSSFIENSFASQFFLLFAASNHKSDYILSVSRAMRSLKPCSCHRLFLRFRYYHAQTATVNKENDSVTSLGEGKMKQHFAKKLIFFTSLQFVYFWECKKLDCRYWAS